MSKPSTPFKQKRGRPIGKYQGNVDDLAEGIRASILGLVAQYCPWAFRCESEKNITELEAAVDRQIKGSIKDFLRSKPAGNARDEDASRA